LLRTRVVGTGLRTDLGLIGDGCLGFYRPVSLDLRNERKEYSITRTASLSSSLYLDEWETAALKLIKVAPLAASFFLEGVSLTSRDLNLRF
jgi:hypothetical protein